MKEVQVMLITLWNIKYWAVKSNDLLHCSQAGKTFPCYVSDLCVQAGFVTGIVLLALMAAFMFYTSYLVLYSVRGFSEYNPLYVGIQNGGLKAIVSIISPWCASRRSKTRGAEPAWRCLTENGNTMQNTLSRRTHTHTQNKYEICQFLAFISQKV